MKDQIIEKARELAVKAKAGNDKSQEEEPKVTLSSGSESSLNNTIKTTEQAKVFMMVLRSFK